jgi:hypothetical protein
VLGISTYKEEKAEAVEKPVEKTIEQQEKTDKGQEKSAGQ